MGQAPANISEQLRIVSDDDPIWARLSIYVTILLYFYIVEGRRPSNVVTRLFESESTTEGADGRHT